jgi:hypothetical protein
MKLTRSDLDQRHLDGHCLEHTGGLAGRWRADEQEIDPAGVGQIVGGDGTVQVEHRTKQRPDRQVLGRGRHARHRLLLHRNPPAHVHLPAFSAPDHRQEQRLALMRHPIERRAPDRNGPGVDGFALIQNGTHRSNLQSLRVFLETAQAVGIWSSSHGEQGPQRVLDGEPVVGLDIEAVHGRNELTDDGLWIIAPLRQRT